MSRRRRPVSALFASMILAAGALTPAASWSQTTVTQVQQAQPGVTTTGSASVYVAPDRVELRFGVTDFNKDLAAAKQNTDEAATKVIEFLREHGIDADDIQTSHISSSAIYEDRYENNRHVRGALQGYEVYRGYGVTVKDIAKFSAVLDRLLTDTTVRVEGYSYKSSDDRKHRDEARRKAANAAREKADMLAQALGATIGSVRTITENSPPPFYPMRAGFSNAIVEADAGGGDSSAATPVGQIEIKAEITATFDLK